MNSLNIATKNDLPNIVEMFHLYLDIFPHIRNDYIERNIKKRNVIYENEVVIIYTKYSKRTKLCRVDSKNVYALRGDIMLHQIVTKYRDGRATKIFNKFLNTLTDKLYLTVRSDNTKAISFYERNGLKCKGVVSWKENTLPGRLYYYINESNNLGKKEPLFHVGVSIDINGLDKLDIIIL